MPEEIFIEFSYDGDTTTVYTKRELIKCTNYIREVQNNTEKLICDIDTIYNNLSHSCYKINSYIFGIWNSIINITSYLFNFPEDFSSLEMLDLNPEIIEYFENNYEPEVSENIIYEMKNFLSENCIKIITNAEEIIKLIDINEDTSDGIFKYVNLFNSSVEDLDIKSLTEKTKSWGIYLENIKSLTETYISPNEAIKSQIKTNMTLSNNIVKTIFTESFVNKIPTYEPDVNMENTLLHYINVLNNKLKDLKNKISQLSRLTSDFYIKIIDYFK